MSLCSLPAKSNSKMSTNRLEGLEKPQSYLGLMYYTSARIRTSNKSYKPIYMRVLLIFMINWTASIAKVTSVCAALSVFALCFYSQHHNA